MTRCWSCGQEFTGGLRHIVTCPRCAEVEESKKIREGLVSLETRSFYEATAIAGGLSEIASVIEWSFEEIGWKLDQIWGVLQSIDKTLKTPSQTQANEWRQMAEELRDRGILDEAENFFLQSLETNPLDYRTYIGLGKTYLKLGEGDKARLYWEKSLPHAPRGIFNKRFLGSDKEEIDYKSYSYRLIGHLDFCEDNVQQAVSTLKTAIELSPDYYLAHYDYAQYCALIGDKENCLDSLEIAVINEPIPIGLVKKERNFGPFKEEVGKLLEEISSDEDLQRERVLIAIGFLDIYEEIKTKFDEIINPVSRLEELFQLKEVEKIGGVYSHSWYINDYGYTQDVFYNYREAKQRLEKFEEILSGLNVDDPVHPIPHYVSYELLEIGITNLEWETRRAKEGAEQFIKEIPKKLSQVYNYSEEYIEILLRSPVPHTKQERKLREKEAKEKRIKKSKY